MNERFLSCFKAGNLIEPTAFASKGTKCYIWNTKPEGFERESVQAHMKNREGRWITVWIRASNLTNLRDVKVYRVSAFGRYLASSAFPSLDDWQTPDTQKKGAPAD